MFNYPGRTWLASRSTRRSTTRSTSTRWGGGESGRGGGLAEGQERTIIHINCLKLGWSNKLFLQTKSHEGQSFTYLQGDPKSDHDPDLGVHFLPVWYNGWWGEAVILWLVVEGLGDYLWSSLGEFLVVTACAHGIVLSKRCSLSCFLIDRYAPLPCTCPNWNPSTIHIKTYWHCVFPKFEANALFNRVQLCAIVVQ